MEILKQFIRAAEDVIEYKSNQGSISVLGSLIDEAKAYLDLTAKMPIPLFDRVVVKPFDPEKMQGTMILPESDNQHYGLLVSKGEDVKSIEVDDIVFWTNEIGETLTVDGEDFILAPYRELKAVVR
jgi:co-chaperonin GroES (HSP10)